MKDYHKVICPKCGRSFREEYISQAGRYAAKTAVFTGKLAVHVGARVVGGLLGSIAGPNGQKYGSRAGGQLASGICGAPNAPLGVGELECPFCHYKW